MATFQINIQKQIDYKTDFPIKYGSYLQIVDGKLYSGDKILKSAADMGESMLDYIPRSKYYPLYVTYTLLDHLMSMKLISRNMDFRSLQTTVLNEFIKTEGVWYSPYQTTINRMVMACRKVMMYSDLVSETDTIVRSVFNNIPAVLNFHYRISNDSLGFFNTVLVTGLIREINGSISGIIGHDFAGDMNSEYVNKNGKSVVYSGDIFKRISESECTVGILVEKSV